MKRAHVGSALFIAGTLLFLVAPATEGQANAGAPADSADAVATFTTQDEGASSRAPLTAGDIAPAANVVAANAGLKGASAPSEPDLGTSGNCGENQVEVDGDYCSALEQKCVRWMDSETTIPRRCSEFAPTGKCLGKTVKKHFCIDKYEYPNKVGAKPVVMKTWYEAEGACKAQGKRLCGDSEWTLACEGRERLPYPYGLERDKSACNIDKPHPAVNERALANRRTRRAETARLWQGESSGARAACVSSYGVFDMTGNVDEWVVNERGVPFKSALKGGYWGPVRDRCRPKTTAHGEDFKFYQIGFRCCAEAS